LCSEHKCPVDYLPSANYADQSYLSTTSFDSYPTQHSFAPFLSHSKLSPYYSLANSSFEYQQPPHLSSTSDSGALVQSTLSSAIGSPSAHMPNNEWNNQQHNMDVFPKIVQQHDGSIFATTGFKYGSILVTNKGCVAFDTFILQSAISCNAVENFISSVPHGTKAWPAPTAVNFSFTLLFLVERLFHPSLIQPFSPTQYTSTQFLETQARAPSPQPLQYSASLLPTKMSLYRDRSLYFPLPLDAIVAVTIPAILDFASSIDILSPFAAELALLGIG
ncbi:hypothetical protein AC578_6712, partial [Pseudocercospora eumusae]